MADTHEQTEQERDSVIKSGEELTVPMPIRKDRDGNETDLDMSVTREQLESYMNDIPRRYVRPEEPTSLVIRSRLAIAAAKLPLPPDDQAVTGPDRQFEARRLPEYKDVDKELEEEIRANAGVDEVPPNTPAEPQPDQPYQQPTQA